jgi:glutaredoxin-related protein
MAAPTIPQKWCVISIMGKSDIFIRPMKNGVLLEILVQIKHPVNT